MYAMCQKSSSSICNLVVHELEKKVIQSTKHIHTLYRYMNHTLVFWTGSLAQLEDFIQFINSLHGSVKFTYEASVQSIQFLDLVIYKGKRFDERGFLDIKCHTKKTEIEHFLHRSSCHPLPVFDGFLRGEIISVMQKKKKKKKKKKNNLDTFVEKKDFFMEKLSARGYNDAKLSKVNSSINFEERQHFIKENPKSTAIPLVFKTKYNDHFARKYIRQALLKHRNIINKNVRLKMIFPKSPMIAYNRSENQRNSLVKAKLTTREENNYTYEDLVRNEEDPLSSPTLQALQHLELHGEQRFSVHRFWANKGRPKHIRSYSLQPETRSWRSFLISISSRYARRKIPDKCRR